MGRADSMSFSAAAGSVRRGSASAAVAALRRSRSRIPASSATARSHDVAAFLALADGVELHPRRGRGQRPEVALGLRGVGQLTRGARDAAQEVARRRNRRRFGHVGDPGREEPRLGGGRRDRLDRTEARPRRGPTSGTPAGDMARSKLRAARFIEASGPRGSGLFQDANRPSRERRESTVLSRGSRARNARRAQAVAGEAPS